MIYLTYNKKSSPENRGQGQIQHHCIYEYSISFYISQSPQLSRVNLITTVAGFDFPRGQGAYALDFAVGP